MKKISSSIRFKLFFVFILLLLVFLFIFFTINANFLDDIFISGSKSAMEKQFLEYKDKVSKGYYDEKIIFEMSKESGIGITIIDKSNGIISTSQQFKKGKPIQSSIPIKEILKRVNYTHKETFFFISPHKDIWQKSITFIGKISDNKYFISDKPLGFIQESSKMAEKFIVISGIITLIIGSFIVYFLSQKLTKPIININETAKEIANLNFDKKAEVTTNDELGTLAININNISYSLNKSLTELKDANSKLKEDIERERSLENMRRKFVSSVSHELKTPISMIQGYADGLKYNIAKTPEDMKYYLDVIIDESQKMNSLIKDLLDLSSYESGTFNINKKEFDISELIRETTEKYRKSLYNSSIVLEVDAPVSLVVNADKLRLQQIISNFLDNAVKHIGEGNNIKVNLRKKENNIYFSVYNNGDKIETNEMQNIWTSFYKIDSNKIKGNVGTGLGLAIVKAIVELHKGTYGVENIEDGVRFWVEIPIE